MRGRLIVLIVTSLVTVDSYCHQQVDSLTCKLDTSVVKALDTKLLCYFDAIEKEPIDLKKGECDFLIQTCSDSLMHQHVALNVYRHYRDSKLMGDEAVAIHVYDTWFASGRIVMDNEMEKLGAKVFAEFNRRSLIGSDAPPVGLYDRYGDRIDLFADSSSSGRFSVLYFYDTSCASCRVQTMMMDRLLSEKGYPIDMYAVYASDDEEAWGNYVAENFKGDYGKSRVFHLWDPDLDSDFQRKYGVIQTPRMFLINPQGVIVGRGLDAPALSQILDKVYDHPDLEYGAEESEALFDTLFDGDIPSASEVKDVADYIAETTLKQDNNTLFRQMTGDMMYYLAAHKGEGYKEGLSYLIDQYILSRNEVWTSEDDTLKIVSMAEMFKDIMDGSRPGNRVPDVRIKGEYITSCGEKERTLNLQKLRGKKNMIIFYTSGCGLCDAEKDAAREIVLSDRNTRVFMVDVDKLMKCSPEMAERLFETFDLSSLPFILFTDKNGRIYRRYVSLVQ